VDIVELDSYTCKVRLSTPLLSIINIESAFNFPASVFSVNHEYGGDAFEEVHLASLICNINALVLLGEPVTLEALRPGAILHPANSPAFTEVLIKAEADPPSVAPLAFPKPHDRDAPSAYDQSRLRAALYRTGKKALDAYWIIPGHAQYHLQSKGQALDAKGVHDPYSGIASLVNGMAEAAPGALAYELATTRKIPDRMQISTVKFPCVIIGREALLESFGEVFAGIFRRFDEWKHMAEVAHAIKKAKTQAAKASKAAAAEGGDAGDDWVQPMEGMVAAVAEKKAAEKRKRGGGSEAAEAAEAALGRRQSKRAAPVPKRAAPKKSGAEGKTAVVPAKTTGRKRDL
jgi:hypothetical protein